MAISRLCCTLLIAAGLLGPLASCRRYVRNNRVVQDTGVSDLLSVQATSGLFRALARLQLPHSLSFRLTIVETEVEIGPPTHRPFICEILRGAQVLLSWRAHQHEAFAFRDDTLVRVTYDPYLDLSNQDAHVVSSHIEDKSRQWSTKLSVPRPKGVMTIQGSRLDLERHHRTVYVWEPGVANWRLDPETGHIVGH